MPRRIPPNTVTNILTSLKYPKAALLRMTRRQKSYDKLTGSTSGTAH
jgi:hypothetical protein